MSLDTHDHPAAKSDRATLILDCCTKSESLSPTESRYKEVKVKGGSPTVFHTPCPVTKLPAGTVSTHSIQVTKLSAGTVSTHSIQVTKLSDGTVSTHSIQVTKLSAGTVSTHSIQMTKLSAGTVSTHSIQVTRHAIKQKQKVKVIEGSQLGFHPGVGITVKIKFILVIFGATSLIVL